MDLIKSVTCIITKSIAGAGVFWGVYYVSYKIYLNLSMIIIDISLSDLSSFNLDDAVVNIVVKPSPTHLNVLCP